MINMKNLALIVGVLLLANTFVFAAGAGTKVHSKHLSGHGRKLVQKKHKGASLADSRTKSHMIRLSSKAHFHKHVASKPSAKKVAKAKSAAKVAKAKPAPAFHEIEATKPAELTQKPITDTAMEQIKVIEGAQSLQQPQAETVSTHARLDDRPKKHTVELD